MEWGTHNFSPETPRKPYCIVCVESMIREQAVLRWEEVP